jgi:hypothetical protein
VISANIDQKILGKIKKCLALSGSSNPNEAATALRQAHALMEKHGVSAHEVTMSDIGQSSADSKTMSRDKPAHWECRLASLVGEAFGCQMMVSRTVRAKVFGHLNQGQFIFVGLKQQAEVASYTATVLIRKCKATRQQWLKDNYGGVSKGVTGVKAKLTRMGDMFAEGWVESISKLVADFANPPEIGSAIEKYIKEKANGDGAPPARSVDNKKVGQHEIAAAQMGMQAAKNERLHRPMDIGEAPLKLAGN